ncbi:MAG: dTMP kinase [Spirochaetaceae bacterium]|jgi:dTMP kinase|nr:dTMP kinase [Spirochaetaceae bacterium]
MAVLKKFIVFEGCDGSGTSTAIGRLKARCAAAGIAAVFTAEPTSGSIGGLVRRALSGEISLAKETLAYLFAADRAEHLYGSGGLAELCAQGSLVFCDRYVLSSLVYQGVECGGELPERLNETFPAPEKLFFFDVPVDVAQQRIADRETLEIYETETFQRKVEAAYRTNLDFCRRQGSQVIIVDAALPPESVEAFLWAHCVR